jgi:hypothetical protein
MQYFCWKICPLIPRVLCTENLAANPMFTRITSYRIPFCHLANDAHMTACHGPHALEMQPFLEAVYCLVHCGCSWLTLAGSTMPGGRMAGCPVLPVKSRRTVCAPDPTGTSSCIVTLAHRMLLLLLRVRNRLLNSKESDSV